MGTELKEIKPKSIKINFFYNALLNISNTLLPLITFPYLSRTLGPENNGKIFFAQAVVSYFVMFGVFGIPTYALREVAKKRDNKENLSKFVQEILLLNIACTVVVLIMYIIAIPAVPKFRNDYLLFVIFFANVLFESINVDWFFKGIEEYQYITNRSLFFRCVSIILMVVFVRNSNDYIVYAIIYVACISAAYILNLIRLKKYVIFRKRTLSLAVHLIPMVVFFGTTISNKISSNIDTIMLGFMVGDAEVGYYNVAIKIKLVLVGLITSLGVVIMPRLSYYMTKNSGADYIRILRKAVSFILITAIPLSIYFFIKADASILFIAGQEYTESISMMQLIILSVPLISLNCLIGEQILVVQNQQNKALISVVAGMAFNVAMNAALIPYLKGDGASLATLFTEALVLLIQVIFIKDSIATIVKNCGILKIGFATVLAGICIIMMGKFVHLMPFWDLLTSAVVFFGIYFILLLITKETQTLEFIQMLLAKIKRK